jgi:hypothetical protein
MPHQRRKWDYKGLLSDLVTQQKMNVKFIEKIPKTDGEIFKHLGRDVVSGEFAVLGAGLVPSEYGFKTIGDEPNLPKEKGVFIR